MDFFPIPLTEEQRLADAIKHGHGGIEDQAFFDLVVRAVQVALDCPTALLSFVGEETQWFVAREGFKPSCTSKDFSLCAYTVMSDEPLVIANAETDPCFANHPIVVQDPYVRFYAGAPIKAPSGTRIGALCVLDYVPRDLPSAEKLDFLKVMAASISDRIRARTGKEPLESEDQSRVKAKSEFITLVSHELRTPLTVILGNSRLMEHMATVPRLKTMAHAITNSGTHLLSLIEHIINYSSFEKGEILLDEAAYEIASAMAPSIEAFQGQVEQLGKSMTLDLSDAPPWLYADLDQFRVALKCVIGNAVHHGGDTIVISCARSEDQAIVFTIADNGESGWATEHTSPMQPFSVGKDIDTRTIGGLGLGLSLTQRIMKTHGGDVQVAREGDWTKVLLRLPAWRSEKR